MSDEVRGRRGFEITPFVRECGRRQDNALGKGRRVEKDDFMHCGGFAPD